MMIEQMGVSVASCYQIVDPMCDERNRYDKDLKVHQMNQDTRAIGLFPSHILSYYTEKEIPILFFILQQYNNTMID